MSVLGGLSVIEISASGAAAWAGRHLADWGANVTIVEPPGGTPLRHGPPWYTTNGDRRSAAWAWLSRGKRSVELGTQLVPSSAGALEACRAADIVVLESEVSPMVLGLAAAELRAALDPATVVLISPFSADGPYAHYRASDLGVNALGGWCNIIGDPGATPLRPGYDMIPRLEGVCAFVAALVALRARGGSPQPEFVEVCGQAVAATMTVAPWLMKSMLGMEQNRRANDWLQGGVMKCNDGWLGCTPLTATHWEMMCQMLGMPEVLQEPGGTDPNWRWAHSAELLQRAAPALASASRFELFHRAQQWRIPAAPVEDVQERLDCPHLAKRGFFEWAEIEGRRLKVPRAAVRISTADPTPRAPVEPLAAWPPAARATPPAAGGPGEAPFAGVRVLDLTHFWAGPYATALLGALGADVIKVESIQRPDAFRYTFAPGGSERWWERSPTWQDTNCNKRGITLDLGSEEGRSLFERLLGRADVVINNFSNRVMPNLGFDDARLHTINPRLIIVSVPGYGPGGPWEDYVGFGIAFDQLAVCASITGYEGGVPRIMGGFCDPLAGLHAVAGVTLALAQRDRTGRGVVVEAPQCEILDSLFAPEHIAVQMGAPTPVRRGNRHEWMAPHNCYRVAGEDRWLSIAVASDEEFESLCAVLDLDLASDPRFAHAADRKANEGELDAVFGGALAGMDGGKLERDLQARGVMACRVAKGWELPADPNLQHVQFFQPVSRELTGIHPYKTWPFRFSGIETRHRRPAPLLGEHTAEVLGEILGLGESELAGLADRLVVGSVPVGAS